MFGVACVRACVREFLRAQEKTGWLPERGSLQPATHSLPSNVERSTSAGMRRHFSQRSHWSQGMGSVFFFLREDICAAFSVGENPKISQCEWG